MKTIVLVIFIVISFVFSKQSIKLQKTNNTQKLLGDMREKLLISYSTYCQGKDIAIWNCFWCKKVEDKLKVSEFFLERESDTFGFIGENNKNSLFFFFFFFFLLNFLLLVYVVFKGTEPLNLRNWISNLRASKVIPFPGIPDAKVHGGFWNDYQKIHSKLLNALMKYPQNKKIVFTGHSRGGALAGIAAVSIARLGFKDRIEFMGFGMPRIGNEVFSKYFRKFIPISWRVVNQKDVG